MIEEVASEGLFTISRGERTEMVDVDSDSVRFDQDDVWVIVSTSGRVTMVGDGPRAVGIARRIVDVDHDAETTVGRLVGARDGERVFRRLATYRWVPDAEQIREADSFTPPQDVRDAAQRGLDLRDEFNRGGTDVGIARARDLSNGGPVSASTIRRMVAFFDRHEGNKNTPPEEGNGKIAWLLWGGDAGRKWAEKVLRKMGEKNGS